MTTASRDWTRTAWLVCAFLLGFSSWIMQDDAGQQSHSNDDSWSAERRRMVRTQIEARGVHDAAVLRAMREVPRHLFVPENLRSQAYADGPLPVGHDQTISQPYIVALMTEALDLKEQDRVLEVGTGSGYQAAVLAEIAREVFTIEIIEPLGRQAEKHLHALGYSNVHVRIADGYQGWPEQAPFDAIIVTAAPDHIPQPLVEQLRIGGRLIIPVGRKEQELVLLHRREDSVERRVLTPVRFVPMTGEAEEALR